MDNTDIMETRDPVVAGANGQPTEDEVGLLRVNRHFERHLTEHNTVLLRLSLVLYMWSIYQLIDLSLITVTSVQAQAVPSSSNPALANLNPVLPTSSSPSPAAQGPTSTPVSNNAPGFRFKYPEAAPTPPGEDDAYWNKVYTAADSRMYNKHGKDANNSRKYRQNGETRTLAFQMMAEKKAKEAAGIPARATAKPRVTQISPMKMSTGIEASGSRDGTPSLDPLPMSISEKIKADGRGRKTSSAAPTSNRATPVPVPAAVPVSKPFNKRGTALPVPKRSHKKKKVDRKLWRRTLVLGILIVC